MTRAIRAITCTLLYKSKVKLEAMAMEKVLQLVDEALDKENKEITCLHLVAGAGAPPSDEYINGKGGEVVLTEYHPAAGCFKAYPKLVLKMTSSKIPATIESKLAYAQIKGSRAVIKMGKK